MYLTIARIRSVISMRKTPEDSYNLPNL